MGLWLINAQSGTWPTTQSALGFVSLTQYIKYNNNRLFYFIYMCVSLGLVANYFVLLTFVYSCRDIPSWRSKADK